MSFRALLLTIILGWLSFADSATHDEPAHLVAGLADLSRGGPELYHVNPPLTRMLAAIPGYFLLPCLNFDKVPVPSLTHWGGGFEAQLWRLDIFAAELAVSLGRLVLVPFLILGLWLTEQLAFSVYGVNAKWIAGWCYVLSPNLLAVGHSISADGLCTVAAIACTYAVYHWRSSVTWSNSTFVGCVFGVTLLTKTSAIFFIVPLFGLCCWYCRRPFILLLIAGLATGVVNGFYGFAGSFKSLGAYAFSSAMLSGDIEFSEGRPASNPFESKGNRFRNNLLGLLPVPLPDSYVRGMDLQRVDFERGIPTLIGNTLRMGRWYDHVYTASLKVPLGIQLLAIWAVLMTICAMRNRHHIDEPLIVWVPLLAFVAINLFQTGMTMYFRYLAPAEPLMIVLLSRLGSLQLAWGRARSRLVVIGCLSATGVSVAAALPATFAYYHELAGGPYGGPLRVFGVAEYGQNLWRLDAWLQRQTKPCNYELTTVYREKIHQIQFSRNRRLKRHDNNEATVEKIQKRILTFPEVCITPDLVVDFDFEVFIAPGLGVYSQRLSKNGTISKTASSIVIPR